MLYLDVVIFNSIHCTRGVFNRARAVIVKIPYTTHKFLQALALLKNPLYFNFEQVVSTDSVGSYLSRNRFHLICYYSYLSPKQELTWLIFDLFINYYKFNSHVIMLKFRLTISVRNVKYVLFFLFYVFCWVFFWQLCVIVHRTYKNFIKKHLFVKINNFLKSFFNHQ